MKALSVRDRPREKLKHRGAKNLSDLELIAVLLGTGTAGSDVFEVAGGVRDFLANAAPENWNICNLARIRGVGSAKAAQLLAAFEWARRRLVHEEGPVIREALDVLPRLAEFVGRKQEYFLTFTLDGAHRLIRQRTVFIGTLNESLVHPREVFADAIADRAASLIFAHNHPSGRAEPSAEDENVTRRLSEVGAVVGIPVLDHIIVAKGGYFSFAERGLLDGE